MLYTALTKKAMKIAFEAHKDQTDKTGLPYIYHPMNLAEGMPDEKTTCAALLHDVVEDTAITFEDLAAEGFPDDILGALRLLTHDPAVPYMDYVGQIKTNPIASAVKLADLRHNSDLTRMDTIDEYARKRTEKYRNAMALLLENRRIPPRFLLEAHRCSSNNREALSLTDRCGCFYCRNIFHPAEITDWIPDISGTARCPFCGIDSVLSESFGYPVTEQFLTAMHEKWFGTAK